MPTGDERGPARTADRGAVEALVLERVDEELSTEESLLRELDSLPGLQRWRDETIRRHRADIRAGRTLGALVRRTAHRHEPARRALQAGFETWQRYLAAGLRRMIDRGELARDADPDALAIAILAAVQGGVLLARASGRIDPLETALDTAINQVRARSAAAPRGDLVEQERADVVQGHVQGGLHRGDVVGGLG